MSTRSERMSDKSLNEKHTKILKELLAKPANKICADCKKKDPRWASHNLGIFICIRCSGIHRAIGTHITKVKSADLDSWTPEQIQNMIKWGNAKANMYWEHNITYDPTDSNIEQWIRAKYERKLFARPGPMPDPDTLAVQSPSLSPQQQQQQPPAQQLQQHSTPQQVQGADLFSIAKPPAPSQQQFQQSKPLTDHAQPQSAQLLASVFSAQGQQVQYNNVKNDILGLFNSTATPPASTLSAHGNAVGGIQKMDMAGNTGMGIPQQQPNSLDFGAFSSAQSTVAQPPVLHQQSPFANFGAFPTSSTPSRSQQPISNFGAFPTSSHEQTAQRQQSFANFGAFPSPAPSTASQGQAQQHSQTSTFHVTPQTHQQSHDFGNFTATSTLQPSFAAFSNVGTSQQQQQQQHLMMAGIGSGQMNSAAAIGVQQWQMGNQQMNKEPTTVAAINTNNTGTTESQRQDQTFAFDGLNWGTFK